MKEFLNIPANVVNTIWWKNPNAIRVFFYLCEKANHEDVNYDGNILKKGECVVSLSEIARDNFITKKQTRTIIDKLKLTEHIKIIKDTESNTKKARYKTRFSLCFPISYEDSRNEKGHNKGTIECPFLAKREKEIEENTEKGKSENTERQVIINNLQETKTQEKAQVEDAEILREKEKKQEKKQEKENFPYIYNIYTPIKEKEEKKEIKKEKECANNNFVVINPSQQQRQTTATKFEATNYKETNLTEDKTTSTKQTIDENNTIEKKETNSNKKNKPQTLQMKIFSASTQEKESEEREAAGVAKKSKRFKKPTIEEVSVYCRERKNIIDAEYFVDYYESKGWYVGKSPMKDWKAAVRNWERQEMKYREKYQQYLQNKQYNSYNQPYQQYRQPMQPVRQLPKVETYF